MIQIWNSAINLKSRLENYSMKIPINFYKLKGINSEPGDVEIKGCPFGYSINEMVTELKQTAPNIFKVC